MNKRKYPLTLFIIGFLMNVVCRYTFLLFLSFVLLVVGFFVPPCRYLGAVALSLDLILSFIEQMIIRATFLKDSDNPDFKDFQNTMSKDGSWRNNLEQFLSSRMNRWTEIAPDEDEDKENDEDTDDR